MSSTTKEAAGPWGGKTGKTVGDYADVNGIKLYYEIHGKGKPLVLLHGGLGAIEMFGPVLPELADHHQVIGVDLQGHGRTADIDRPLSLHFMADDIAALIKHIGLSSVDVMGYSLGAGVAVQLAARHPELVEKLVIISAVARRDAFHPEILAQQGYVNASAAEMMKQTPMYQLYASLAPRVEDFPKLLDKIGALMSEDYDFSKDISGITSPTLVVAGDSDISRPSHAVEIFNLLGGGLRDGGWDGSGQTKSQLAIMPGLTHYNIFASPAVAQTVLPFLDQPGKAT
jgi:pimeloyl-ACP methyl ester carboxylesterase